MEDGLIVSYDSVHGSTARGSFQRTMEPKIEPKKEICEASDFEKNHHIPNGDEMRQRSESSKARSLEDILPVLVAVWGKMSSEIRSAYKIFRELVDDKMKSTLEPFVDMVDAEEFPDYYDIIKEPMNLFKISEKFHNMEYDSITEVIADIRQIIENCFMYNGFDSFISKQAQKLEVILEQKLNLLSRELRSKTTIAATNKVKNKEYLNSLLFIPGRRSLSQKHRSGETSMIAMQMNLQKELEGKEKKRLKDKEKKELHSALEEECEKWTKEILHSEYLKEVKFSWEIPSVGIFLCILKGFLNLQDFIYSEFEIGMLFPRESSLVARIFTSLLVTSFQRKKLNSRDPMKYSIWSEKVKSRIVSWYKIASTHGQDYSASLYGFDADLFQVLGFVNPFQNSEFHELPLKSRMWILKALCEVALEQDSILRDYFGELEFIDRQDVCLGFDTEGFSYHYISHFGATDIRIYKQKPAMNPAAPKLRDQLIVMEKGEPKHEDAASKNCVDESKIKLSLENDKGVDKNDDRSRMLVRTSKRIRTKRSLSPSFAQTTPKKKEKKADKITYRDFFMIADDISSLKSLHDKFDNIKQEKGNRKQAEKELQQSLDALYVELKKRETNFIRSNLKARMKIMMECKEWEKKLKSEDEKKQMAGWDSENDEDDDEVDDEKTQKDPVEAASIQGANALNDVVNPVPLGDFVASQCLPPSDTLIFTKEGRKLRSRRFDVKDLFSESAHPQSKRPKSERLKQGVGTQLNDNAGCMKNYNVDICESDEVETTQRQNSRKRRNLQQLRRKYARHDEISERDIQMLRRKRLEKIKQDLKEGKILTAEEQRNLMHLGLSSREIEELKKLQKRTPELETLFVKTNIEEKRNMNTVRKEMREGGFNSDNEKSFSFYDGLKALADVASLAKQTPDGSSVKYKKEQVAESRAGKIDSKGNETGFANSVVKTGDLNLDLVGIEKNRSSAKKQSSMQVVEDRSVATSSSVGNTEHLARSTKSEVPPKQIITVKNIVVEGTISGASTVDREKEKICSTPSREAFACPVTTENCVTKCIPLILQRKRPNILRKPVATSPVAVLSDLMSSKDTSSSARISQDLVVRTTGIASSVGNGDAVYEVKPAIVSSSRYTTSQTSKRLTFSQSGTVDIKDYVKHSRGQVLGANQVDMNGRAISQLDNIAKESLPVVSQQSQSQKQPLGVNAGKPILASSFHNIQTKSSLGPVILVTQSSPVIGQAGVPLILASNSHLMQGKGHEKTQPLLLLTPKQPIVQQGSFQSKQPQQQCLMLKQQGDTCLLAYEQPPQQPLGKVSSVTDHATGEVERSASNSCPVTTLKSKLHAAALKKKLGSKGKTDILQSVQYPIISNVNAPIEFTGRVPQQSFQSLPVSGMKVGKKSDTSNQRKTINIIKTQPKIAPKTVHIIKSNVLNGSHPPVIVCSSEQTVRNDAKLCSIPIVSSDVAPLSNTDITSSPRDKDADTMVGKAAKTVGIVPEHSSSIDSLKNVQIIKKVTTPVNSTDTDKAVYFTNWSNAYVPKKHPVSSSKQNVVAVLPGKASTSSVKPPLTDVRGSVDSITPVSSQILLVPASFSTHQRTMSLPAQIVQLPAQIPSKQEVCGAGVSNRGVATAAQLVIVPQTRAPKQIRPAVDSTTAVKALKSLEQAMKPVAMIHSLMSPEIQPTKDKTAKEYTPIDIGDVSSSILEQSIASTQISNSSVCSHGGADTSKLLLNLNQDVVVASSSAVKDKSSVTFSTLVPIPCAEVKASVSNVVSVTEEHPSL